MVKHSGDVQQVEMTLFVLGLDMQNFPCEELRKPKPWECDAGGGSSGPGLVPVIADGQRE